MIPKSSLGKYVKLIGSLAIFFGLAIVVEDTFIIYFRDIYHTNMLKSIIEMFQEDIFHISLCLIAIKYFLTNYQKGNEEVAVIDIRNEKMRLMIL